MTAKVTSTVALVTTTSMATPADAVVDAREARNWHQDGDGSRRLTVLEITPYGTATPHSHRFTFSLTSAQATRISSIDSSSSTDRSASIECDYPYS